MNLTTPDLLYPLRDNNRDEIFLVEYDGFIKNITESIVIAMLLSKQDWIEKYTGLNKYDNLSNGDIYDDVSLYSPEECLLNLSNNLLDINTILNDINELISIDTLLYQSNTVFEFALDNLLQKEFVKECHFIKTRPFYEHELTYISHSFIKQISKINIVSGTIKEAFEEFNPTTCFVNNINDITNIINTMDTDKLIKKLFVLRNTSKTVFHDNNDRLFHYYPEISSIINNAIKSKKYLIGPMYAFRQNYVKLQDPMG